MLHMESPHQGTYAPLSQVMTDSESEEEIHNTSKHQRYQRQQLEQQQQQQQQEQQLQLKKQPPTTLYLNQQGKKFDFQRHQYHQWQLMPEQKREKSNNNIRSVNVHTGNGIHTHQPSSYTTNMQNTFRSVMMSDSTNCDPGSNFSSFNSDYDERNIDADNVAILGNNTKHSMMHHEPMSSTRRCCFAASLLLCVFAIFGFVWLVPCNENGACPASVDRIKTHNWLNNYTKIELKGGVNIVNGLRSWENNLIFLYRGDAFFPEFKPSNTKRNGIISLIGSSGAVAWYDEMVDEPIAIDCTLLDVDANGRPDCLVIDEYGELGAINPISGEWHWRFKERSVHKVDALDFPVILPDLDGDGVLEILMVTSASLEQRTKAYVHKGDLKQGAEGGGINGERNILRILSGRYGKPIGEGFKIRDCDVLRKLQLENQNQVTFNCLRNNTEVQRYKTLAELFALITNKSIVGQKLLPASEISQHRHYGQRKDIDAQRNIYSLSGRELVVENRGKCPDDCNVTFILCETRKGKTHVLRNFTNSGMYGMVPAQWHFKNTKHEMSGFVMKFWKWTNLKGTHNTTVNLRSTMTNDSKNKSKLNAIKDNMTKAVGSKPNHSNKTKKSRRRRRRRRRKRDTHEAKHHHHHHHHAFPTHTFDSFDHLVQKRNSYTIPEGELRTVRSVSNTTTIKQKLANNNSNLLLQNYKMQTITETVILVLFIGTDTRIENTSQSNIVQFCRHDRNEMICQPDLNNQENSMLIADLDQDGSQELVSYMSTFVEANDNPQDWKLVTYVRLLRLQSELPTFYDDDKRN